MRFHFLLGRIGKLYGALVVATVGVVAVLALAIAGDALMVSHSGPTSDHQIHMRYYLLPLGGGFFAALVLWRRVIPAGHDFWRVLFSENGGFQLRSVACVIGWLVIAAGLFLAASVLQRAIFGFFLPS